MDKDIMSCDTNYTIKVIASKKKTLQALLKYLKEKKERWDNWSSKGKSADELLKQTGEKEYSDVVSWGFSWGPIKKGKSFYMMRGSSWANENCQNLPIRWAHGELASIARKFPEIEWQVKYSSEDGEEGSVSEPFFEG